MNKLLTALVYLPKSNSKSVKGLRIWKLYTAQYNATESKRNLKRRTKSSKSWRESTEKAK